MDKIEEVKKILKDCFPYLGNIDKINTEVAHQICRLFEPKSADCKTVNPYPPTIVDEGSDQVLVGHEHRAWEEGRKAERKALVEWLDGFCQHRGENTFTLRLGCYHCWQDLKTQVGAL